MTNDKVQLFENQPIRTAWIEDEEEWYFSIVDVVPSPPISQPTSPIMIVPISTRTINNVKIILLFLITFLQIRVFFRKNFH